MANLDAQILADLNTSFLRVENGFGTSALLAPTGTVRTVPVATGIAVVGIFDDGTAEGDQRGGPRWWGNGATGYEIGRYLTVTGQGTFLIEAIRPEGDGRLFSCLLGLVT